MRWSIGLVGERLFTGGRLGNGSRLRFGNRLIFESVADDSCANSTGRFYVLREVCRPPEGASFEGWPVGSGNGSEAFRTRDERLRKNLLCVGVSKQPTVSGCDRSIGKCSRTNFTKEFAPQKIVCIFYAMRYCIIHALPIILSLSRRTSVPETKQGLRQSCGPMRHKRP